MILILLDLNSFLFKSWLLMSWSWSRLWSVSWPFFSTEDVIFGKIFWRSRCTLFLVSIFHILAAIFIVLIHCSQTWVIAIHFDREHSSWITLTWVMLLLTINERIMCSLLWSCTLSIWWSSLWTHLLRLSHIRALCLKLSLMSTWRNFFNLLLDSKTIISSFSSLEFTHFLSLLDFKKKLFVRLIHIIHISLIEVLFLIKESLINWLNKFVVVCLKPIFKRGWILIIVAVQSKLWLCAI